MDAGKSVEQMTPHERAEKILEMVENNLFDNALYEIKDGRIKVLTETIAQIEEAEREAHHNSNSGKCDLCHEAWKLGWNAAREKAKGIAQAHHSKEAGHQDHGFDKCSIADRIGKMEAGG